MKLSTCIQLVNCMEVTNYTPSKNNNIASLPYNNINTYIYTLRRALY